MLTLFRKQNGQISSSGAAQTFDKALDDWLEYTSGRVKRSTLSTYRAVAERYIRPGLGALYTGALTGETAAKFLENASADYAPATVRMIEDCFVANCFEAEAMRKLAGGRKLLAASLHQENGRKKCAELPDM